MNKSYSFVKLKKKSKTDYFIEPHFLITKGKKKITIVKIKMAHKIETLNSSLYPITYTIFSRNIFLKPHIFSNQQKNFITGSYYCEAKNQVLVVLLKFYLPICRWTKPFKNDQITFTEPWYPNVSLISSFAVFCDLTCGVNKLPCKGHIMCHMLAGWELSYCLPASWWGTWFYM